MTNKIITDISISVTIQLGASGIVFGIDVDLTGYIQCSPVTVAINGHLKYSPGKVD
jgi:hypothetical protein